MDSITYTYETNAYDCRVLLDEINLASSETLERLCGLLDDAKGRVTLSEKGDSETVRRHPNFWIFAAMNPATDAGKKDPPSSYVPGSQRFMLMS